MSFSQLASGLLLGLAYVSRVQAFGFTTGKAVQCGDFSVSWTGGSPPFSLLLVPAFGTPFNISIPSSAFNNGQGNYSTQLHFEESERFVAIMSDSTGFNAGGTSELMTVGAAEGASCNTTDRGTDFVFQTPNALQQCRSFTFVEYTGAQSPVTFYGVVPAGTSFTAETRTNFYQWTANVAAGTSMIFFMTDSAGRQGGATDVLVVGRSDTTNCLNNSSLSTTASATPSQTASTPPTNNPDPGKPSVAAITGAVVGVLILLGALVAVGIFFFRRRQNGSGGSGAIISPFRSRRNRHSQRVRSDFDLMGDKTDPFTGASNGPASARHPDPRTNLPPGHEPSPFMLSPLPPPSAGYYDGASRHGDAQSIHSYYHDAHSSIHESSSGRGGPVPESANPFNPTHTPQSSTSMSAAQRKRAMAGIPAYTAPSRFILHTDMEDTGPPEGEGDVVELPPQYSERRAPLNPSTIDSVSQSSTQATPALHLHSQDPNAEVGRHLRS